ncbi:MAG: PKD domain-containing protein [Bacteroidota bacterium]
MENAYRLFLIPLLFFVLLNKAQSQNTCANALPVAALPYSTPAHTAAQNKGLTTCNTVNDYTSAMACGSLVMNGEDAVFTFTPDEDTKCINIGLYGSGIGTTPNLAASAALFIFDGCPNAAGTSCIAKEINKGKSNLYLSNLKLTAGKQYYIMVDGGTVNGTNYRCYPYQLKIDKGSCSAAAGSDCASALEMSLPMVSVPGTTSMMSNDYPGGTSCIWNGNGEDVVYHLNLPVAKCLKYQVDEMSVNGVLYIFKGCPGAPGSECIRYSMCRKPECRFILEEITLAAGDYYFVFKSDDASDLNFKFTVQSLSPDDKVACETCDDKENCAPCLNAGFEKMNLDGWKGFFGTFANPKQNTGFRTAIPNDGFSRHTVTTRGHYDSLIKTLPVVPPVGGDFAVRLGNCNNNGQSEQLVYTIQVDSNNTNFIYQYAVIFEDPEHDKANQPSFSIEMKIGDKVIECAAFSEYAKPGIEGFKNGGLSPGNDGTGPEAYKPGTGPAQMWYKEWTTVNIPLLDFIGQTATITFTTKDCSQLGHFGYAYIDARCERIDVLLDTNLYCNKDTITLHAPNSFAKYKWSTGETTQDIQVSKSGKYTVTCTTVTGCVIQLSNEIKIENPPIPGFTWEFNCKDSVVTFHDTSVPRNGIKINKWAWSFGDGDSSFVQHPTHKYTVSGNYNVSLTLYTVGGCTSDTMITIPIDVFMPQGKPNAQDTIRLCEKETLRLTSDSIPLTTYEWKGPNGFSSTEMNPVKPNVTLADTGWYRLKVVVKECVERFDSTYLIVEPLKKPFITPDTIICPKDTARLYCGGGDSYLWSPGQFLSSTTSANPKAYPSVTTVFSVTMFNNICPDTTLRVKVTVLDAVVAMQMPDTLRACINGNIQLQASTNGFDVFKWTGPNGFTSTQQQPQIVGITQAKVGYYRLNCSISNNICSVGSDSTWVDMYPDPVVTITRPASICPGDSIQLTASGAATYVWSPATGVSRTNIANPYFKPTTTRLYTIDATSINGCKGKDTITVVVKPLPKPNLGPDLAFCLGDTAYIRTTQSFDSLRWSDMSNRDSLMIVNTGTYAIRVWSNGCTATDSLKASFQDPGSFSLGPDTILCTGTVYNTTINLGNVDSVRWNDNVRTLNRAITVSGTYSVKIYAGKCDYSDTIVVSFDTPAVINLGPDSVICSGGTVTYNGYHPRAVSYKWNTGDTTASITAGKSGDYILTINSIRCSFSDTVNLVVITPPSLSLGPDQAVCEGDTVDFSANTTGNGIIWNTGATVPAIRAWVTGDYSAIVTFGPCTLYDTVNLYVQPHRKFKLSADTVLCEDQSLTVTGPDGYDTYRWSSGETTKDIQPKQTGDYILTTVEALCTSYDTIHVQFDTIPDFVLPPDPTICKGSTVTIDGPANASNYHWSNGASVRSITVGDEGVYSLTIVNGTCSYVDEVEVFVITPPNLYIGPDKEVCIGTGARFGEYIPTSTYRWSTGDTTAFIDDQRKQGLYSVVVTYKQVCEMRDTAELMVTAMPEPDLGADQLVCEGTSVNLFANTFGKFTWNANSTTNTATVYQEGTYWVHVTNGSCENSDTVNIRFQPSHRVLLPPDVRLCSGEKYDIVPITDAKKPIYKWSTGVSSQHITVYNGGDYVITVVDGVCEALDTIHITVNPLPDVEPINVKICPEDSLAFSLPADYKYYFQADMRPFTTRMLYPKMEYNLVVEDSNGCKGTTHITAELDLDCERDIYVPNTFTPNGDGDNDVFRVVAYGLKLEELLIFNRWGELIFRTTDPAKGWDGNYKGEMCKTDVYEWKVTYTNNYQTRKVVLGHVNLLK